MSVCAFGPFILDTAGRRLTRDGQRLAVPGKAWQILLMLTSPAGIGLLVSDIAALSGFREMPTFARMFERRYGMTPSEARHSRG
jgi:AraC-like DNA-binding protein